MTDSAAFNETIQELEDEMEENQTTILARNLENDIKKMVLMKNYHQEVENSLRFIVDEQNQMQISEILQKCFTFERNFEKIIKEKQKHQELETNDDNSDLFDLQQDLQRHSEETQRHYKEIQRLLQPIIQSYDERKESIGRFNKNIQTGIKEIEETGPTNNVEIRGNDIKSNELTIADPETEISNSTTMSIPYSDAQPLIEKVIPDQTATIGSKDFPLIVENEEAIEKPSLMKGSIFFAQCFVCYLISQHNSIENIS